MLGRYIPKNLCAYKIASRSVCPVLPEANLRPALLRGTRLSRVQTIGLCSEIFRPLPCHNNTSYTTRRSLMTSSDTMGEQRRLKYVDIGINLGDPVFRGSYHGKQAHQDDLKEVVQRALDIGCQKMMITGSNLKESKHAVDLARQYPGVCYATVGVHPCSTQDFENHPGGPDVLMQKLKILAEDAKQEGFGVAFGEIGIDYDRLFLSPKETQLKYFEKQMELAIELQLPLFLHSRSCHDDFERIMKANLDKLPKRGLVHSFTGSLEEMQSLVALGFDIGVNGCSMKTEENLAVVREVPLERLQIETDGPWCEIRASHASSQYLKDGPVMPKGVKKEKWQSGMMVKGRNEPVTIAQVAHVIAKVKGISPEEVCEATWRNSVKMFGLGEAQP